MTDRYLAERLAMASAAREVCAGRAEYRIEGERDVAAIPRGCLPLSGTVPMGWTLRVKGPGFEWEHYETHRAALAWWDAPLVPRFRRTPAGGLLRAAELPPMAQPPAQYPDELSMESAEWGMVLGGVWLLVPRWARKDLGLGRLDGEVFLWDPPL